MLNPSFAEDCHRFQKLLSYMATPMEKIKGYHQQVDEPDITGTYTARDYVSWKLAEYVELIGGKIFKMSPAPARRHQDVAVQLTRILADHFRHGCHVYASPFDVYLVHPGEDWRDAKNIVEPDLCVICDKNKLHDHGCVGAPDLVIEILSPGTAAKDLGPKRDLYQEYGVHEYWVVHPRDQTVVIHTLENGKYRLLPILAAGNRIQSVTFPALSFDLSEVFPQD